ncbi:tRNA (guanosine(37)-N1)-methyltransferase TrmD [Candidatus Falkowbacteria bacterium RIFOXYB2_FULL_47_14]|uniref:tRNA (guanine-N(1)-)-methyltransferase n=1 Tax=Candidatus Falkowbacteria bacterium RIFOXYA2_FULL_47_19 TaxID=1797994 RepID=A0A1F5SH61_9BACT|nr:MAG: tRNA (guanosine(37)-N1)-methyltransferase TrmD [Candidatus Falkowbacteria bacterium RIFOXYA2_FULL_47_19]OGF34964.1 MAG: tRNA (guanosine(37)-N1)-methyltransferase TrmD [Candidatus Falkowbacteria bacterium RIFOXYC2_FULL_46_15]OGF43679.1 MAG: tRNA (guanosine(37)-N1)-methyltransferase TrmD [Candidatus Falkowbacteria bacterium RIFOXYB2_FULL_47_14]
MTFHIITIFPGIFDSYFSESILKRAQKNNLIGIKTYDLRDWTNDRHRTVDDTPYGGGAGMIMKTEPLCRAIKDIGRSVRGGKFKIVLLSAKGKTWNQRLARKYAKLRDVILVCGRYEGVDERVTKFIDEEISIGDYVLTGGEIPAMAIVDSVARLLPGVLGNKESAERESHSEPGLLEYPQYTRPEVFEAEGKKYRVPKVLLSGNHKKIEEWRGKHSKKT